MYEVVKFTFPFADNFGKGKPRPSLVISPAFGKHNQLIVAYITSNLKERLETDVLISSHGDFFSQTGLKSDSLIKIHRLITITPSQIGQTIGILPKEVILEIKQKILQVFQLSSPTNHP